MDVRFKKEQIGTLFVWVGALEGRSGVGWSLIGVHPKRHAFKNKNKHPRGCNLIKLGRHCLCYMNCTLVQRWVRITGYDLDKAFEALPVSYVLHGSTTSGADH